LYLIRVIWYSGTGRDSKCETRHNSNEMCHYILRAKNWLSRHEDDVSVDKRSHNSIAGLNGLDTCYGSTREIVLLFRKSFGLLE
jgi:hypothetical protein